MMLRRTKFLRELLGEFGASLHGHDPGVTAFLPNGAGGDGYMGEDLSFNREEWGWLEPLLVELREARRGARPSFTVIDMCWCKKDRKRGQPHGRACSRERRRRGLR